MGETLRYRGYEGTIEASVEDGVLHGRVLFIKDVVSYEGKTIEELRRDFEGALEDYLAVCEQRGIEPDKPFKGAFNARVSPDLHKEAAVYAARSNRTINDVVREALAEYLARTNPARPRKAGAQRRPRRGV